MNAIYGGGALIAMIVYGYLYHLGLSRILDVIGVELIVRGESLRAAASDRTVRANTRRSRRADLLGVSPPVRVR